MDHENVQILEDYSNTLCKSQFGKTPESIEIRSNERSIVFFYKGLTEKRDERLPKDPDERYTHIYILLEQFIFPSLRPKIEKLTGKQTDYAFIDWKIETDTAAISILFKPGEQAYEEDSYVGKAEIHRVVEAVTDKVQKSPVSIESFWLDQHLLLIIRSGLLINLEKKLVKKGFNSQLRVAKRELELDGFIEQLPISDLLHRKLNTAYLDWAFEDDLSLLTLDLGDPVSGD
ncbi:hypothetical protein [Saccharibacillus sp. JS10]|uniref:hypothetical protein n=1 Tax=Saccharibacillus sp. JS10 TaxID=2950552 RepID=UPI00210D9FB9|nr:hypothetical protein [Saccharibacillus sp. JS10]MCQ4085311.1 hypothetical protein [Saccharibacillus sp. JS10]